MVIFMAHPVGAETNEEVFANIQNAKAWYHLFICSFDVSIVADWIISCETLDDLVPGDRLRGQKSNAGLLARVDELWLCGGRISHGMRSEMHIMHALNKPIRQWIDFGYAPPKTLSISATDLKRREVHASWDPNA